jgi:phospholipase C
MTQFDDPKNFWDQVTKRRTMSRFGDDEFFGDEGHYDYDDEYAEDHESIMGSPIPAELMNQWKLSEIQLETQKINFIVLRQAVQTLEKSWMWRFYSLEKRVRMICDTYYVMMDLINIGE